MLSYKGTLSILFLLALGSSLTIQALAQQQGIYSYELIAPQFIERGMTLPLVIRKTSSLGVLYQEPLLSTFFTSPDYLQHDTITLKRGTATFALMVQSSSSFTLQLPLGDTSLTRKVEVVADYPTMLYQDTLPKQNIVWDKSANRIVQGDLVIPEGTTLSIQSGTIIKVSKEANIIVHGRLIVEGSKDAPVVFTSQSPSIRWGGIILDHTEASFSYCFCLHGGADTTRKFAHSNSQAVLQLENSHIYLNNTWIIYNTGKAFGARNSTIKGDSLVIAYCDTGGEFWGSLAHFDHAVVQNIPDGDGVIDDDDNDGWYFAGHLSNTPAYSTITNSVITTTEDDCIDHGGGHLLIANCVLENAYHEGVAGSTSDTAIIINSLVRACEQGIEAGYGYPTVIVDHCFVTDNKIGLRFGDSYTADCTGSITATNTILYNNEDNVWNYELKTKAPVEGAITTSYSITNDVDYDLSPHCLTGIPTTTSSYFLQPTSVGKHAGTAGSDMGLVQYSEPYCRVVITELYRDLASKNPKGNWIELHNRCPLPVNISKWTLHNGKSSFMFPDTTVIPPYGFLVLSPDTLLFQQRYPDSVFVIGNSSFTPDTTGLLVLRNAEQEAIDSIAYTTQAPWPKQANSFTLSNPWLDNSDGGNWYASEKAEGTPGYYLLHTTSSIVPVPSLPLLTVQPTPCQNECTIEYTLATAGLVEFEIYSLTGRKIQHIAYEQAAKDHSYRLDCSLFPTGIFYIVQKLNGAIIATGNGIHIKNP